MPPGGILSQVNLYTFGETPSSVGFPESNLRQTGARTPVQGGFPVSLPPAGLRRKPAEAPASIPGALKHKNGGRL